MLKKELPKNSGDEERGQNLVFRDDKSQIFQVQEFFTSRQDESMVLLEISDTGCGKARNVAEKLKKNGYRNVKVFSGGMIEWSHAGFPMEG